MTSLARAASASLSVMLRAARGRRAPATFLFLFIFASGEALGSDSARFALTAVVQPVASIAEVSAPQQISLSAADVMRGYLDLAQALDVAVLTNLPGGVLLAAGTAPGPVSGVELSPAADEPGVTLASAGLLFIAKQGVGLRLQRVRLRVRLLLGQGAAPGPINWPVSFSLAPR
jgi:hypothetical protein